MPQPHLPHPRPLPPRPRSSAACIPLRSTDLEAVVAAARAGEDWAWTAIVTRFRSTVLAIARRHRLAPAEQEEVAQETWLRLFRKLGGIHTPAALGGWIATTARHETLRILQRAPLEDPTDTSLLPDAGGDGDLDAGLTAEERREALHRALERVPEHQGRLLRLLLTRPAASYEEIGAALGMPVGSIGPTRQRALGRLRGDAHLARVVAGADTVDGRRALRHTARYGTSAR